MKRLFLSLLLLLAVSLSLASCSMGGGGATTTQTTAVTTTAGADGGDPVLPQFFLLGNLELSGAQNVQIYSHAEGLRGSYVYDGQDCLLIDGERVWINKEIGALIFQFQNPDEIPQGYELLTKELVETCIRTPHLSSPQWSDKYGNRQTMTFGEDFYTLCFYSAPALVAGTYTYSYEDGRLLLTWEDTVLEAIPQEDGSYALYFLTDPRS